MLIFVPSHFDSQFLKTKQNKTKQNKKQNKKLMYLPLITNMIEDKSSGTTNETSVCTYGREKKK